QSTPFLERFFPLLARFLNHQGFAHGYESPSIFRSISIVPSRLKRIGTVFPSSGPGAWRRIFVCAKMKPPMNLTWRAATKKQEATNSLVASLEFSLQTALSLSRLKPELHAWFGGQHRVQVWSSAFRLRSV